MSSSPTKVPRKRRANLTLDLDHVNGEDTGAASAAKSAITGGSLTPVDEDTATTEADDSVWSVGFAVTYGAFFFAGAASIATWSSITLCLDFFTQKYPDERIGFVFPVINMSTLLVISLYMVLVGRTLPLEPRVHGSLATYLVFVIALPLANMLAMNRHVAYTLSVIALIGSTISSSVMQSSMYGLAGVFGPIFLQALDGGKAFGAMLLFAFRLTFKWYFQPSTDQATVDTAAELHTAKLSMGVFFGVSFWMVAMTWALYVGMKRTRYAQPMLKDYFLIQSDAGYSTAPVFSPIATPLTGSPRRVFWFPSATATLDERSPLLSQHSSIEFDSESSTVVREGREISAARSTDVDQLNEDDFNVAVDMDDLEKPRSPPHTSSSTSVAILEVFRTAAKPFFTLFLSFFVCLSCFPGIISAIPSTTWHLGDWFPILLVGCYNTGDLLGKNLPVRVMYFDVRTLHVPWALQLAFIPFFLAALLRPFSDVLILLATTALGLVTGYVATSAMILAPSVCDEYQKEVAGMIASLCAIIGLCAGSYNGLALETLVQLWHGSTS